MRPVRREVWALAASAIALLGPRVVEASGLGARVIVFPLEGKGFDAYAPKSATAAMLKALSEMREISAIDASRLGKERGFDAVAMAVECNNDILCLVQIGQVLEAQKLIVGHIRRDASKDDELRLNVVDVAKASMVNTLRWMVPAKDGVMEDAAAAAARQLVGKQDARIVLELNPPEIKVTLYGEPLAAPKTPGEQIGFWSGVYHGTATAEGYEPRVVRLTIPSGGPTNVAIQLENDPLYVGPKKRSGAAFARTGPGAETPSGPSPLANPWAWALIGSGGVAAVIGGVVMGGAQSDYNDTSAMVRYTPDRTIDARQAVSVREDARSTFGVGSKLAAVGVVIGAGGLVWMFIDAVRSKGGGGSSVATDGPRSGGGPRVGIEGVEWAVDF